MNIPFCEKVYGASFRYRRYRQLHFSWDDKFQAKFEKRKEVLFMLCAVNLKMPHDFISFEE